MFAFLHVHREVIPSSVDSPEDKPSWAMDRPVVRGFRSPRGLGGSGTKHSLSRNPITSVTLLGEQDCIALRTLTGLKCNFANGIFIHYFLHSPLNSSASFGKER